MNPDRVDKLVRHFPGRCSQNETRRVRVLRINLASYTAAVPQTKTDLLMGLESRRNVNRWSLGGRN
jgi:hypothetical protein